MPNFATRHRTSSYTTLWAGCLGYVACAFLCAAVFAQEDSSATAGIQDDRVLISLKLARQTDFASQAAASDLPYTVELPSSCKQCSVSVDPNYTAQNAREIDFALLIPKSTPVALKVHVAPGQIRRVLLEGSDLAFTKDATTIGFTIPPQTTDRPNSAEFHTHLLYPGLDLRFEHADPVRRAGYYRERPFPALQRQAAANLEFAQREAILMLGLGDYVADQQSGTILLMGFDTNDPHGHTDAPPHMHMHMRWPQRGGTQIGHYYIDERGLLVKNVVGISGWNSGHIQPFLPGEPFTTYDLHMRGVYTHIITREGWLTLGVPKGAACRLTPATTGSGFDSGARVQCQGFADRTVMVHDDIAAGKLTVTTANDGKTSEEHYTYDRDTGRIL